MNKKRILIVYQEMVVGGSTSNLLCLLNLLDYSKVQVDLILRRNQGKLMGSIPSQVNILPPMIKINNKLLYNLKLYLSPKIIYYKLKSKYYIKKKGLWYGLKYFANKDFEYTADLNEEYDIAIGYLEGWTHRYIAKHVKAKQKIGYLHLDYKEAGIIPDLDKDIFEKLDNIIFVSQKNKESFDECFPEFHQKSVVMPHLFSQDYIRQTALENKSIIELDHDYVNFVTVGRIVFSHKGFDRVLHILKEHHNEACFQKFRWYIIGDGPDFESMKQLIKEYELNNQVFMLGQQDNAYSCELGMDMFLQPSYYEGKPAAVYEAMILGVPPLVTEYASAHEQIENEKEGIIVKNDEEGIYQGLTYILNHPERINEMKKYMKTKNYNNTQEIDLFYKLIHL